ncbi:transposase [Ruoffia tabacinasalis]|uniref:Transposase n=1 Tax=Ruoffia tabacinasalis TaxID=87458 RepID=A0A5R9DVU1_9LACT|nr:helix-turn-helix domain-containing protein [Ruoffia tabacinasalis]TLQ41749.1 transposase [Ruoffia tabacinasalis]
MSKKYSYEFKLNIVEEYLNGELSYTLLSKKYHISTSSLIKTWVNQFKTMGKEGLRTKRRKESYPLNFKLNVLRFKQDTGASYRDTANTFGIGEPSIIANWKNQYEKYGTQGLNKPQGRPPKMPKSNPNQDKNETNSFKYDDQIKQENELLKKENEYLRIELEYLKKLKALGLEDPRADNKQK